MDYQIRLEGVKFTNIDYKVDTFNQEVTSDLAVSLDIEILFDELNNTEFSIKFEISLKNDNDEFNLQLTAVAHFSTDKEVDDEFKVSSFPKVSAPAIAFPYIRVFISNMILNSGYNPVILPSFNFVKLAQEKE